MQTRISIIVPCYQAELTIQDCVESILRQSFKDFELVIVNDGSTDRTKAICDNLSQSDHRVKVIHQENQGRSAARENGVRKAQGEWISFVDADDQLPISALQLLAERISDETDIIFGNGYSIGKMGKQPKIELDSFRHMAVRGEGTIGVPWGSLYRKSLLGHDIFNLPKDMNMGEDYIFWLRIIFKTSKPVAVVEKCTYNKGKDNTSNSFIWTVAYAARIQAYRQDSIPASKQALYLADTISDRKANLWACTLFQPRKIWANSSFYHDVLQDMQSLHIDLTFKERLFLSLPTRWLRKLYSWVSRKRK